MRLNLLSKHPLQKWQQTVWLLLVLLTPLFVNLWVEQQFEASKVWLLRSLIWFLALLCFSGWLLDIQFKPLPKPIFNLLIVLVLVLLLATALSQNHYVAIFGSLERGSGALTQVSYLLLFVCVATQIEREGVHLLLRTMIFTAVPITLLGLAQAAGWQLLPVVSDGRTALVTTLGRANFTGAYLALLLPLTLVAVQTAVNRWERLSYGALVGLELLVIALTQARAAWIAAVVGIAVLIWLQRAPRWTVYGRWLAALGGIAMLLTALVLLLQRSLTSGGSIAARWTIWQASLRLLWPRLWLGYGADTLELYFPAVYPPQLVYYQGRGIVVDRAHNWLLDYALSYGVVATLIFIVLLFIVLRRGWQHVANNAHPTDEQRWLTGCMAAICAQWAGNLFLFEVAATAVIFWLLLAITTAMTAERARQQRQLFVSSRLAKGIIILAALGVGWAVWHSNVRPLWADFHSWQATQAFQQADYATAQAAYETAVFHQPNRPEYHVALAFTAVQLGNYPLAETALSQAIQLRPTDPVPFTQLAAVYGREAIETESAAKTEQAYSAYEEAATLAPTIALTYQQYADFALRSGNVVQAQGLAETAVNLDATDAISFSILGWTHITNGDLATAEDAFKEAIRWQPDVADFHLGLATVHYQQGNLTAAQNVLQTSLLLDPTNPSALTLQRQLQER